jgi:integrase
LKYFQRWCLQRAVDWLPACPATIAGFVDDQTAAHRISTIKRRVAAIIFAHRMSDLPSPADHSTVHLALRRASRAKPRRPEQVRGLTHDMLVKILATPPVTLTGLRDAALVSTGYDTLCRSSEIAAMQVEHIRRGANDTASILIPRSKADRAGNGRIAHFSPATVECLDQWLEAAGIDEGPLFQALHLGRPSGRPLRTCSIRRLVKRAARSAGLPELIADQLSGHSMRVGAAQDMMVTGFDMLAIMQAGGWTTPHVVSRYVENASTRSLHERRWAALGDLASFVSASSKSGAVFERF